MEIDVTKELNQLKNKMTAYSYIKGRISNLRNRLILLSIVFVIPIILIIVFSNNLIIAILLVCMMIMMSFGLISAILQLRLIKTRTRDGQKTLLEDIRRLSSIHEHGEITSSEKSEIDKLLTLAEKRLK